MSEFATGLAKEVLDAIEPMLLRIRREQAERRAKFEKALPGLIRKIVEEALTEALAVPARLPLAHSFKAGIIYLAGSLVTHSAGLWQALDNTGDEPGTTGVWRLLANGINDLSGIMTEEDPRLLTIRQRFASGDTINLEIRLPLAIHRGKWDATTPYQQGDEVTHNGSTWRAVRDATGACPPGPDWLLVAQSAKRIPA
jgi:hypothetical protein